MRQGDPGKANGLGRLPLRIGIHVGDVVVQGDDLMGDGVNVCGASRGRRGARRHRHQSADARAGARQARFSFMDWGEIELRNIQRPVHVFGSGGGGPQPSARTAAARQALDRRAAVPEHERGSGAGVFCGRHGGGHHHSAVAIQVAVRDRPQFELHLQGNAVDVRQVGRELGVRYVLEGSVRKAGNRVRITGSSSMRTGAHLWADRFDGDLEDIFDLQDRSRRVSSAPSRLTCDEAEISAHDASRRKP